MADVLIVEDEADFRTALRRYLEVRFGWTVHEAATAHEAIALIPKLQLDGVVVDRRMPDGSGSLTLGGDILMRWLFDSRLLSEICVIMLTAFGEVKSASNALSMGAWQYLEKPQDPEDIYRLLAPGIALKRCHRLRRQVASDGGTKVIVDEICEIIQQTLAPDFFNVYFLVGEMSLADSGRRFVREICDDKPFLYLGTRVEVRAYDPILPDAGTLMAVRIVANQSEAYGVLVMESMQEGAFDPRWQEVLSYFADLVGLSETIRRARDEKIEAERQREKQRAEDEARRREIENLRVLNRELRHRLSNSIGTMYQYTEGIRDELVSKGADPGLISKIQVVQKHLNNFVEVMGELREVTNPVEVTPPVPCNAREVVTETLLEKQSDFAKVGATFGFGDVGDGVIVLADRGKLVYCLECILQNGLEAVVEGRAWARPESEAAKAAVERDRDWDEVIADLRSMPIQETLDVAIDIRAREGMGEIRVRDRGIGFDPEIEQRLFIPLFTTKLTREANSPNDGMGLFSVRRLIEAMGGEIIAHSDGLRKGADFTIRLPLAAKA